MVVKSTAVSSFPPNALHALARPVWSTTRACQWYAVLFASPASATKAMAPFATRPLEPLATFAKGVPTGWASTSSPRESPASGSVTVPRSTIPD